MTERPILFNGDMVRAILDGRKTQTRRVIQPKWWRCLTPDDDDDLITAAAYCPFGKPGDRLWVREKFLPCKVGCLASIADATYVCFEDGAQQFRSGKTYEGTKSFGKLNWPAWAKWRPSIHMPRWASRITLEITGVRVERVQEISVEDAAAEGIESLGNNSWWGGRFHGTAKICRANAASAFEDIWNSIHGPDAWAANPWVWVVEFKR